MSFNCTSQTFFPSKRMFLGKLGFLTLIAVFSSVLSDAPMKGDALAEPVQGAAEPSGPSLAGDQAKFDEGVRAYDAGDPATAFEIWLPLAKAGDLAAQRNVAHLLRQGVGVEADLERALWFYERAARSGLASAALNAGMMRLDARADYFDTRKAAEWLTLAATAGSPIAQWELSKLLETGDGVRKDAQTALVHLRTAAEAGHEEAIAHLAELTPVLAPVPDPTPLSAPKPVHRAPAKPVDIAEPFVPTAGQAAPVSPDMGAAFMKGVFQFDEGDYANAAATWTPLAERGVIEAQYRLGRLYQFGMGVPHNFDQARHWLSLAAGAGHEAAQGALTSLPPAPIP